MGLAALGVTPPDAVHLPGCSGRNCGVIAVINITITSRVLGMRPAITSEVVCFVPGMTAGPAGKRTCLPPSQPIHAPCTLEAKVALSEKVATMLPTTATQSNASFFF